MDVLSEVLEPGKVTLVAPLSREVGDGFLERVMNSIRNGLGMQETEIAREPS
jgi:hypothetical protein